MNENISSNNIITTDKNTKISIHNLATNIVNTCIDKCIQIETERQIKGFYLLKYNTTSKNYSSKLISYESLFKNFHHEKYFLIDVLHYSTNHLPSILPIPVLNGKYLKENICINELEDKLVIIFINMKDIDTSSPFTYFMDALNTSNINLNIFNNTIDLSSNSGIITNTLQNIESLLQTAPTPPPPIPPPPPPIIAPTISNSLLNTHSETYSEEIEQMKAMGFTDEYKIIESLIVSDGDVNNAIHYYLQ